MTLFESVNVSDTTKIAETFSSYEKHVFTTVKEHLVCLCGKSEFTSQGKGGKPNAGGFRILQLQCHPTRGCGKKVRLEAALQDSPNLKEEAKIFSESLEIAKQSAINAKRMDSLKIPSKKRAREPSPPSEDGSALSLPPTPNVPRHRIDFLDEDPIEEPILNTSLQMDPMETLKLDFEQFKKDMHETVASLKQQLEFYKESNALLAEENKKLKSQLLENTEPPQKEDEAMSMVNEPLQPQDKQPTGELSYAAITARHRPMQPKNPKKLKRNGIQLFKGPPKKDEILKLHIRLGDKRPLKNAKSSKEISQVIDAGLKAMGVKSKILAHSKIGNSILELFVEETKIQAVKEKLNQEGIEIIPNFTPMAPALGREVRDEVVIKRLAYLYRKFNSSRFRRAILAEYPDTICERVKLEATTLRETVPETAPLVSSINETQEHLLQGDQEKNLQEGPTTPVLPDFTMTPSDMDFDSDKEIDLKL